MDYIAAAPEMTLLGLICVVMIADLFVDDEDRAVDVLAEHARLWSYGVVLFATAPGTTVVFSRRYVAIRCRKS